LPQEFRAFSDNVSVKPSAEPSVAGDDEDLHFPTVVLSQQCMGRTIDSPAQIPQHVAHLMCIRPRGQDAVLGPFELGRRDHFHGFGDLLRILNCTDFPAKTLETWHGPFVTDDR
jgi:hypothetical protein